MKTFISKKLKVTLDETSNSTVYIIPTILVDDCPINGNKVDIRIYVLVWELLIEVLNYNKKGTFLA
jgi:hypothetical protein